MWKYYRVNTLVFRQEKIKNRLKITAATTWTERINPIKQIDKEMLQTEIQLF